LVVLSTGPGVGPGRQAGDTSIRQL